MVLQAAGLELPGQLSASAAPVAPPSLAAMASTGGTHELTAWRAALLETLSELSPAALKAATE